jgi:PAS domain S-box-containing protein
VAVGVLALLTFAVLQMQAMVRRLVHSRQTLKRYIYILQSVFDNMSEGVLVADEKGQLLGFNPAAEQLLQLAQEDVFHTNWTTLHGVYLPNTSTPCPMEEFPLLRAVRGETVEMVEIFVQHRMAPEGVWLGCTARPLREKNGEQWGGLMVIQNITERKRAEQLLREKMRQISDYSALLLEANARLEEQAMTDGLTSLKNRRAFCKSLDQEMQRATRYGLADESTS